MHVSEEEARVGATRSVMDYLIEGARLDPDMSCYSGVYITPL
jgi:hypothetical protein